MHVTDGLFEARGSWAGLDYVCWLEPAPSQLAWQWRVRVESHLEQAVELDLDLRAGRRLEDQDLGCGQRVVRESVPRASGARGRAARERTLLPSEHARGGRTSVADDRVREPSRRREHRRSAVLRQDVPGDGRTRGAARERAPGRAVGRVLGGGDSGRTLPARSGRVPDQRLRRELPVRPSASFERAGLAATSGAHADVRRSAS